MGDLYLSFPGNITGRLTTPENAGEEFRRQLAAHAPGIGFSDTPPEGAPTLSLEYVSSDTPGLSVNGLNATLRAPESEGLPADIPHLLYGLERKALLERHLYPVHAACVGKDGEYTLLVGHSGSGKTTLASELIGEGLKLYSGNKTVVRFDDDGIKAVAGTRIMTAVAKDFNRHAYDLQPSDYAPEEEVKITRIVIVRINDGVEECQTLSPLSALHTLYPYFLDTVNADVVVNGKDVFSGTTPEGAGQHLAEHLGAALRQVPVQKISGSAPYMRRKALAP